MDTQDIKQSAVAIASLAVSAGLVYFGARATPTDNLIQSLAPNLLSSGICALCDFKRYKEHREKREALANHDIQRMVASAWGEAAIATLKSYCTDRSSRFNVITEFNERFKNGVFALKASDIYESPANVDTINRAIRTARRAMGDEEISDAQFKALATEEAKAIEDGLIESVMRVLEKRIGADAIPSDLKEFLKSGDGKPSSTLLGQLCTYIAFHLKTNTRASIAIQHYCQQRIEDKIDVVNARIQEFCESVLRKLSDAQSDILLAFEKSQSDLASKLTNALQSAAYQPRLDAPFDGRGDSDEFRFTFRERRTPLTGREQAMDALLRFMGDPRPILWTVISGPAGTGKSRLAAELIAKVRDANSSQEGSISPGQWRAGFLRRKDAWLSSDSAKWIPDADTLIVIDYAGESDVSALRDLLAHADSAQVIKPITRVIMIDRQSPDDAQFGLYRRLCEGDDASVIARRFWREVDSNDERSQKSQVNENGVYASINAPETSRLSRTNSNSGGPLALKPLSDTDAMKIAADWAGREFSRGETTQITAAIESDPELGRPLFAALLGDAIGHDGFPIGALNPVSVAQTALARLFGARFNKDFEEQILTATKGCLAVTTASQGVHENHLFDKDVLEMAVGDSLGKADCKSLVTCMHRFVTYHDGI